MRSVPPSAREQHLVLAVLRRKSTQHGLRQRQGHRGQTAFVTAGAGVRLPDESAGGGIADFERETAFVIVGRRHPAEHTASPAPPASGKIHRAVGQQHGRGPDRGAVGGFEIETHGVGVARGIGRRCAQQGHHAGLGHGVEHGGLQGVGIGAVGIAGRGLHLHLGAHQRLRRGVGGDNGGAQICQASAAAKQQRGHQQQADAGGMPKAG